MFQNKGKTIFHTTYIDIVPTWFSIDVVYNVAYHALLNSLSQNKACSPFIVQRKERNLKATPTFTQPPPENSTDLPISRHSCLDYRLPAESPRERRWHTLPHSHDLPGNCCTQTLRMWWYIVLIHPGGREDENGEIVYLTSTPPVPDTSEAVKASRGYHVTTRRPLH